MDSLRLLFSSKQCAEEKARTQITHLQRNRKCFGMNIHYELIRLNGKREFGFHFVIP